MDQSREQAAEIKVLKECNEDLRSKLQCEKQEVGELLSKLVCKDEKIVVLECEVAKKDVEIGGLKVALDVAKVELDEEKRKYEIANRERKDLECQLKIVIKALDDANKSIDHMKQDYAKRVEKVISTLSPQLCE